MRRQRLNSALDLRLWDRRHRDVWELRVQEKGERLPVKIRVRTIHVTGVLSRMNQNLSPPWRLLPGRRASRGGRRRRDRIGAVS